MSTPLTRVCIRFELPAVDRAALVASMRRLSPAEVDGLWVTCRLGPRWWFPGLQQRRGGAGLAADVYEVRLPAGEAPVLVAVDQIGTSVFVWSR